VQQSATELSKEEAELAVLAVVKAREEQVPTLWNIRDEMKHVVAAAEEAGISVNRDGVEGSATVQQVSDVLRSANLIHMACHGVQNPEDALLSRFCLADGDLTVAQLMGLDLKNAFLAFLSACETAKGDSEQPDQTIHLAAVMLFIGFRTVIATLW
jgi:CHAT domain-containing protein